MRGFRLPAVISFVVLFSLSSISQSASQVQVTHNTNLREAPSSSAKIIELLRPPETLDLIDPAPTAEGYYHVRVEEGEEGFVYRRNAKLITSAESEETMASRLLTTGNPADDISDQWDKGTPNKVTFHGKEGDCPFNGNKFDPDQYTLKNRTDVPDSYHPVKWKAIDKLKFPKPAPMHRKDWTEEQLAVIEPFENVPVQVVGYVVAIKPQNGGSGEGTNCKFNQTGDVDTHIAIVEKAGDGEADSVVVEFTPRFLKKHLNWTKAKLAPWLDSENPVRVSGWLMLDPDHAAHLGKYRDTLWEIHPITKFEVFKNGKFVDLDEVSEADDSLQKHSMSPAPQMNAGLKARERLSLVSAAFPQNATGPQRFPDSMVPLPSGWNGPVFHLSQDYPAQVPTDSYPWLQFDPTTQPDQYMASVLQYCLDGNMQVDWVLQSNAKRGWYHAPWMHWGAHGREPIHGLTFERSSLPGELAPQQTSVLQNWAVGMYNAPGGYTLGQVWKDPLKPNVAAGIFPPNTVSIKLLFTEGTAAQVPYLAGSKTWQAYVYANLQNTGPGAPRVVKTLSLLQVDLAVRDPRANGVTGWVFGTFIYDGRNQGDTPYAKLRPVGLMWGNDPNLGPAQYQHGARPQQTRLYQPTASIMRHYGWLRRLNGPVDNPKSSCLSCHSTAQWPVAAPMVPPANTPEGSPAWMQWFRNIPAGQPFSSGSRALDYSLQLASGIQNLAAWSNVCSSNPNAPVLPPCSPPAAFGKTPGTTPLDRSTRPPRRRIPLGFPVHR